MKKVYLQVDPGQTVFLVFASVRGGYNKNIVIKGTVEGATVTAREMRYKCKLEKVVLGDENVKEFVTYLYFENANIDTGYRGRYDYPVFTTKEKCIQWLKG